MVFGNAEQNVEKLSKDNKFSRLSERGRSKESILKAPKRGHMTILDQKSVFHNQRMSMISQNSQRFQGMVAQTVVRDGPVRGPDNVNRIM